jgi:hypothetical protein
MNTHDQIGTEQETAAYLHVTLSCLRKWRRRGFGPRHLKFSRMIRYRKSDVIRWMEQHASNPASDAAADNQRPDDRPGFKA